MNTKENNKSLIWGINDTPPVLETAVLGLQHYLTMFGSTVAIPLLLAPAFVITNPVEKGWLIATMFFVSGITTLLQTTFGNRLPIVQGGTFSFLAPTLAICSMAALATSGWEIRMQHVQGAIIAGSFFEIIIGASGLMGRFLKYVGPITIAPTIALIGLALFKFGAPEAGRHWPIGGLTIFLIIILVNIYVKKTVFLNYTQFYLLLFLLGLLLVFSQQSEYLVKITPPELVWII